MNRWNFINMENFEVMVLCLYSQKVFLKFSSVTCNVLEV
jgi:hypothetical protein